MKKHCGFMNLNPFMWGFWCVVLLFLFILRPTSLAITCQLHNKNLTIYHKYKLFLKGQMVKNKTKNYIVFYILYYQCFGYNFRRLLKKRAVQKKFILQNRKKSLTVVW